MDTGHSSPKKFLTCAHLKNVLTRNLACTLISDVPNLATADISENPNVSGRGDSAGSTVHPPPCACSQQPADNCSHAAAAAMGRFPYYSMGGGSIKMRSWKPISLLIFYDWKVMGDRPRAISRRKRSIERTITPSFSMVKKILLYRKTPS